MSPSSSSTADSTGASREIRRVAILFAGGPAPAANAVISTAAASFHRQGIEVLGILHGYAHLVEYGDDHPMKEGRDYIVLDQTNLRRTRNTRGILIGTSRTNPGKDVTQPAHLADPERTAQLRTVHRALSSLGVDALVSIGGDDTLKTANKFKRFQDYLPAGQKRIAVVHVPKTIDNDYRGIDFTFGYFTAVETPGQRDPQPARRRRGRPRCTSWSRPWAEAPAGWPTVRRSPARPAWSSASRTSTDDLMTEETVTDPKTGNNEHPQDHERRARSSIRSST